MIPGGTKSVSLLDRLVARWDISQITVLAPAMPLIATPVLTLILILAPAGNRTIDRCVMVAIAVWVLLIALDIGRFFWTARQPYAPLRWLHSVAAVAGQDLFRATIATLAKDHAFEPAYVVTRADVIRTIRNERVKQRDAAKRSAGVPLVEIIPETSPHAQAPR